MASRTQPTCPGVSGSTSTGNRAPKVSVLMSVFNGAPFLGEAIASVLRQSFSDFELLVVDDASTDASARIVLEMDDPRIRLIRCRENRGAPVALNIGLAEARGRPSLRRRAI